MKKWLTVVAMILSLVLTASQAGALCVGVSKANLRNGPGTSYEVAWQVFRYMPLKKVGVSDSGQWYAVEDADGDVTWIRKDLVTDKYKCAVVSAAEEVNVRTGPGTKFPKGRMGPAKQYYSFKLLKKQGPWLKVRDEWGGIGWIHRSYMWTR